MPPYLFGCGSAALWFAFFVPSMSCPMWGRLSSRPWPLYPPPSAPPNAEPCRCGPACPPPLFQSQCSPCSLWFAFSVPSVLLARRFFSAREDFLCRHTCLVAALPRCGLLFSCPPCRVRCGAGFRAGLGPFTHRPLRHPMPSRVGADQRVRPLSSNLSVLRVLCGLPSPCPLYY